jgi:hypothetical protein
VTITSAISNGSGTYLYQWQSSPDGSSWTNIISGGVSANYNPPTATSGSTYYRVLVTDISNGCSDPVSNNVLIVVEEQPTVSIVVDNDPVCIGGISTITSTITNGSGLYNYQWQSSPDGSAWSNITVNGNSANYVQVASVPGTLYYRLLVTDLANGCNDPVSNTISITVENQPTVNIAVDNPIICVGGSAIITSVVTNGSGLFNYQWQSSPDGSSGWSNITVNGTSASYNVPSGAPASVYYRLLVTDLANGCTDPMSNTVNVTVEDQPTVSIDADNDIVCVGGSVTITSTVANGSGTYSSSSPRRTTPNCRQGG